MSTKNATSILSIDLSGNAVMCAKGKAVPSEIMIFAAGRADTNDGRFFINDDPDGVIDAFEVSLNPIPIDHDHFMEITRSGPAAGWVTSLENRDGEVWAKVEWTKKGAAAIADKEYRFISPAFLADADQKVKKLSSVAMTNMPAFEQLAALASRQTPKTSKENTMDRKALCSKLGLPEDATDQQILAAIDKKDDELKIALASSATPKLDKFVPRADFDKAVTERDDAQKALASRLKEDDTSKAEALVDKGITDGRIAPASKDFYLGMCAKEGGLAEVKKFLETAPKIVATTVDPSNPDPATGESKALTSEQKQVADQLGIDHKEYTDQLKQEAE